MPYLRFGLLAYAIVGIFVSGGLFFRRDLQGRKPLALFVFFISFEMLEFLFETSAVVKLYPYLILMEYFPIGFLYGPLIFIHLRQLLGKDNDWKVLLHFIPVLLMCLHLIFYWEMPPLERIEYMRQHFLDRIMPLNYLRAAHQGIYGLWCLWILKHNFEMLTIKKRSYTLLLAGIYFLATVLISWYTMFAESWRGDFIFYYFSISTLIFLIAYLLYEDPSFLQKLSKKYLTSSVNDDLKYEIRTKLNRVMKDESVFLSGDLNLKVLSEKIGVKSHQLSQTLSELMNEGFNDFVNRHRVEHAKKLLLDPQFDYLKIEAIGLECGFNNKVTFNNAFKKFAGMTPAVYKDQERSLKAS